MLPSSIAVDRSRRNQPASANIPGSATGEYRNSDRHTEHDHEIRLPVVRETTFYELCGLHQSVSRCWFLNSKRWGKRAASSLLCVTTIKIVSAF